MCVRESERGGGEREGVEGERERERQTDRQTDRHTDRQTDSQPASQPDRQADRQTRTDRQTDRQIDRQRRTDRQTDRQGQTDRRKPGRDRQTATEANKQTDSLSDIQIVRQTYLLVRPRTHMKRRNSHHSLTPTITPPTNQ